MKWKNVKKSLAVLLSVFMFAGAVLPYVQMKTQAADTVEDTGAAATDETPEDLGLERITISDFGIGAGAQGTSDNALAYQGSGDLNDKYLDVDIKFSSATNTPSVVYASAGKWDGLRFFCWNSVFAVHCPTLNKSYTYTAEEMGLDAVTDSFNLKFAVSCQDVSGSGASTVSYTFWVNDKMIAKDVKFVTATGMGSCMGFNIGSDTSARVQVNVPEIETEETQPTPEELGFSRVTITDFGFGEGGTYEGGSAYKAYTGSDTLDGKYLDVDLQFPTDSSTNAKMHYLASAQGTGLGIWMWTGSTEGGLALQSQTSGTYNNGYNKTYSIAELGLATRTEKFNLKLGVKLVGTEVQYTMWINDVLIAQNVVITGLTSIANGMDVTARTNTNGGAMIMTVPETEETQQTPEELGFSRVTITDFGFGEGGTYEGGSAYKAYTGSDTLDGKYLDVDLQFPTDSSTNAKMHYLASAQGTGLGIWMWTGSTEGGLALQSQTSGTYNNGYNKTYSIAELGLATRTEKFNLKLGVKLVGTEVQYTMWINDVLIAQNVVITGLTSIANGMDVTARTNTNGGAMIMTVPETEETQQTPEELGFSRVTIKDFGFGEGGTYQDGSAYKAYTGSDTLDGKYLDVDLQFPTDSSTNAKMHYLASAQGTGLGIWMWTGSTEGGLALQSQTSGTYNSGYNKTYSIAELGLATRTEKFNLKLGVKLVGTEVQYTMWINDVLIAQNVVITGLTSIANGMDVTARTNTNGGAMIMTVPVVEEEPVASPTPEELGYTRVTNEEIGYANDIYTYDTYNVFKGAREYSDGLNEKYLDVNVAFSVMTDEGQPKNAEIVYGSSNAWHGLRIFVWAPTNTLYIRSAYDTSLAATYTPSALGIDSFDEKFNLKLGVKWTDVGTDSDENTLHNVTFSLWINDVLIDSEHEFESVVNMGSYMNILMEDTTAGRVDSTITFYDSMALTHKVQKHAAYSLDDGPYFLIGEDITVNGVAYESGSSLTAPGDYVIRRTSRSYRYSQVVSLYKVGDADLDGMLCGDADLTKLTSLVKTDEYTPVYAAEHASDLNNDGKVTARDLRLMQKILAGEITLEELKEQYAVASHSYDYIGGSDVMPITGFFGPYADQVTDIINDTTFQKVKDLGINVISSSPETFGAKDENQVSATKAIALAEKYGIGYWVNDSDINAEFNIYTGATSLGTVLDDGTLAGLMNRYAGYENVVGINVMDEPTPNYTYDADTLTNRNLQNYDGIASKLNSYSNLAGYINMYPNADHVFSDVSAVYTDYINAVKTDSAQKMLNWDTYPFVGSDSSVSDQDSFFAELWQMREAAGTELPFWGHVAAGGDFRDSGSNASTDSDAIATEAETYWNVNMLLAFGAKGITWFPLVQPTYFSLDGDGNDYNRNGLIGADGTETTYYSWAKAINASIAEIDEVLMKATSTGIIAATSRMTSKASTAKTNMANGGVTFLESTGMLASATYTDASRSGGIFNLSTYYNDGVVVGCFDYQDTEAFYVVNYDVERSEEVTLNFTSNYKYHLVEQGSTAGTTQSGTSVTMTIPAGKSVLVVMEDNVADMDLDGDWDSDDVTAMKQYLLGDYTVAEYIANINKQGEVNSADLVSIKRRYE